MKIIGIIGRAYFNKDDQKIFQIHETIRKVLSKYDVCFIPLLPYDENDYLDYEGGLDKVNTKIDYLLEKCDGFVAPGGTYSFRFDEYIMDYAIKNDKPLLCICHGFQALCNMYTKDRNSFNMTEKLKDESHHKDVFEYAHNVNINKDTLLYDIIKKDNIPVNSSHYYYVSKELEGLTKCAYSDDNVLEAVCLDNKKFVLGVEWHPECIYDEYSKKIFDRFIDSL